ncbi:phytoene/squalene synthase family protein [Flavobacterium sp. S87F.05.LMB.W.Kidney.N]|uniref:phytoene/squalene synthase family protein n=1 Tax=Flavobacterium sp. S87F.05.LMB.W.Kidney.N TaxID=1278758 RepID=UPI001065FDA1|nr:phytoene/squalene synthase family protein [Flavobacterium sp. S87F.05.LMB.W.Kidney.N]TDX11248.1 phytoene/squalene synthetase [Flavobacterium sp. S87F.05.LMB.W.Kidney.N]
MKKNFDDISFQLSRSVTKTYSTSFSQSVRFLSPHFRQDIYNIYAFVRFADEIVDSFHDYDKQTLLETFKQDCKKAISSGISMNPVLNSFQSTVNNSDIPLTLIDSFFSSMELDLIKIRYNSSDQLKEYIYGSAEVIGIMCLKIFVKGDEVMFERLKPAAMKLGSAFQKINFLRDLGADMSDLNRIYFPELSNEKFQESAKILILKDIDDDLKAGLSGISQLPSTVRFGVYLSYVYFSALLDKLKRHPISEIKSTRIRLNNFKKTLILFRSFIFYRL